MVPEMHKEVKKRKTTNSANLLAFGTVVCFFFSNFTMFDAHVYNTIMRVKKISTTKMIFRRNFFFLLKCIIYVAIIDRKFGFNR